MADRKKILKVLAKAATICLVAGTLALALVIMARRDGLSDQLDFGAGAYYYADIPDFQKYVRDDVYSDSFPDILYWIIFLAWGGLMYWLWRWIDRH
ncbi:MAG: hypothetical protein ACI3ZH_05275 [Candidatus Cryptobacteroides sp.]